jgi:MFS family permease
LVDWLLINERFARFWLSEAVSLLGDAVFDLTVLLWISIVLARGQPWAPAAASGVLIAVLVPTIVVGPLAGVFVDRWDPRRTMLWSDAIRAVTVGSLVVLPLLPTGALPVSVQLVTVYAVVVLNTVVSRFFMPARFTIIADIVPADDQPRASGITQGTSAAAGIIGPPLAAPLLFTAGIEWALILNALSFVFSYLVIRNVQMPALAVQRSATGDGTGFWREFRVGLKTIVRSRVVRTMVIVGVIANIAGQVFSALGVFFVIANLHTQARFFGFQDTMLGTGAIIGAAIAGWLGQQLGPARTIWVSLLLCGLFLGVYARTTSFLIALGVLLLVAIPLGAMNTAVSPLLIRAVPREVLGRVFATFIPAIQSMSILGVAVAGWLSSSVLRGLDARVLGVHFGTYDTIFLACGVILVIAGAYAAVALREPSTS